MDKNQDLMERFFNDPEYHSAVSAMLMSRVYEAIRARAAAGTLLAGRPAPSGSGVQAG